MQKLKLVPMEPTADMIAACEHVWRTETPIDAKTAPAVRRKAYQAMIAAAPAGIPDGDVEEAFLKVCETLDIQASASAYLEVMELRVKAVAMRIELDAAYAGLKEAKNVIDDTAAMPVDTSWIDKILRSK